MADFEESWNETIGASLQQLRLTAGLTQGEMAQQLTRMGVPLAQQTIAKIENGTRPLKMAEAVAITTLLDGVGLNQFLYSGAELDLEAEANEIQASLDKAQDELSLAAKNYHSNLITAASWLHDNPDAENLHAGRALRSLLRIADPLQNIVHSAVREVNAEMFARIHADDIDDYLRPIVKVEVDDPKA